MPAAAATVGVAVGAAVIMVSFFLLSSPRQTSIVARRALRVHPPAMMLLVLTAPNNPGAIWASLSLPKSGVLLLRAPGIVDGRFLAEQVINVQYEVVQFEPIRGEFRRTSKNVSERCQ